MGRHQRWGRYTNMLVSSLAVIFCLVVLGVAGAVAYVSHSQPEIHIPQMEPDGNVQIGTLSDPAGRQAKLDDTVREDLLTFAINTTSFMRDGKSATNLMIENPPENTNRFTVTIRRDDTEEEIYKSGYLDLEQYIKEVPLDQELPVGECTCTVWFDAHRISDNAYTSRATAQVRLYVQN